VTATSREGEGVRTIRTRFQIAESTAPEGASFELCHRMGGQIRLGDPTRPLFFERERVARASSDRRRVTQHIASTPWRTVQQGIPRGAESRRRDRSRQAIRDPEARADAGMGRRDGVEDSSPRRAGARTASAVGGSSIQRMGLSSGSPRSSLAGVRLTAGGATEVGTRRDPESRRPRRGAPFRNRDPQCEGLRINLDLQTSRQADPVLSLEIVA
jgi:hypothetical protein